MKWESRKGENVVTGIKGWQKVSKKAVRRITLRLNDDQFNMIGTYCKQMDISMSELIKKALNEHFINNKFELPDTNTEDPNQMKMF